LSPSQIIVIQIYYLSFLKEELRLAGRYQLFKTLAKLKPIRDGKKIKSAGIR